MSSRKVPVVTNQIYHIFNRGVDKAKIFFHKEDYERFLAAAIHYRTKTSKFSYEQLLGIGTNDPGSLRSLRTLKLGSSERPFVQILAYCLMPNHFHFLIKQLVDAGLTSYLQRLTNSYAHYINMKYERVGPLFQGRFKNVLIESDPQLLHVSRYIHLNPLVSNLATDLESYRWSSHQSYVGDHKGGLCDPKMILDHFKSKGDYQRFVLDQADYARTLEDIKHLAFD